MDPDQLIRHLVIASEQQADCSLQAISALQLKAHLSKQRQGSTDECGSCAHLLEVANDRLCAAQSRRNQQGDAAWSTALQLCGLPEDFSLRACQQPMNLAESFIQLSSFSVVLQHSNEVRQLSAKAQEGLMRKLHPPHQHPSKQAGGVVAKAAPAKQYAGVTDLSHDITNKPSLLAAHHMALKPASAPPVRPTMKPIQPTVQPSARESLDAKQSDLTKWGSSHSKWTSVKRPAPPNTRDSDAGQDDLENADVGDGSSISYERPGMPGFQTARQKLVVDLAKKGQAPSFGNNISQVAPRSGLTRPQKKQVCAQPGRGGGGGGGGGGASGRGFVPPFVQKALEGPPGEGEVESPYPPRLMDMLKEKGLMGPEGAVPEALERLDPKIVEVVFNEVLGSGSSITWDTIAGLGEAKRLIQELVVWPIMNPQLFKGARAPPKGLLLFGPPGTGKTLIGRAIAANIKATFFSISASSLTSKWIGEGEKMVRALFTLAGLLQPSVIFIDEIDSLLSARKSEGEHEASRRLKTEMLIQMEGCDPASGERRVLLVGATNRPEELDEAARRRMPKQLYIPLPCEEARAAMILSTLSPEANVAYLLSESDIHKIVHHTRGYSGSDMRNLIQEACQGPVRDFYHQHGAAIQDLAASDLRQVVLRDFQVAAKAQKRTVSDQEVERYTVYNEQYGARYTMDAADDLEEW